MRICLIRCPSPFLIDERVFPPLGLMAVGTTLLAQGHDVCIHDGPIDDVPLDFDHYGLGPTTPEYHFALAAKDTIRKHNPRARIVIGGPHATLSPQECLDDGFDCVVTKDGETAAEKAFRGTDTMLDGGEQTPLDDYPITDRSLLDIKGYKYFLGDRLATTIMTGRGCAYQCRFCCKTYRRVRLRSAASVISEIRYLQDYFDYTAFAFPEDIFIVNRDRATAVSRYLKDQGIVWRCLGRADIIVKYGPEFVRMMADSGCVDIGMGVESGSDKILATVGKGETADTIMTAVKMIKRQGIRVKGFFILGLPGETAETIAETRAFLDEADFDDVDMKIYQPYPGSPIWENREDYDITWADMDTAGMFYKGRPGEYFGNVATSSLTTDEIVSAWIDLEAKYKNRTMSREQMP